MEAGELTGPLGHRVGRGAGAQLLESLCPSGLLPAWCSDAPLVPQSTAEAPVLLNSRPQQSGHSQRRQDGSLPILSDRVSSWETRGSPGGALGRAPQGPGQEQGRAGRLRVWGLSPCGADCPVSPGRRNLLRQGIQQQRQQVDGEKLTDALEGGCEGVWGPPAPPPPGLSELVPRAWMTRGLGGARLWFSSVLLTCPRAGSSLPPTHAPRLGIT